MRSKATSKLSILLNLALILFLVIYFLVPFSATGFWAKVFSPLCQITSVFQGEDYVPGWCLLNNANTNSDTNVNINSDSNANGNVNTNGNINSDLNANTNANSNVNTNGNINADLNSNVNVNTNTNAAVANPAAVKCEADGGVSSIITSADGSQAGLCAFKDGSICDEWAYYRGECRLGQCHQACQKVGTNQEGWYNSCTDSLIKFEKCAPQVNNSVTQNIVVSAPIADQQLTSPIIVSGRAKTADNKIYVRVKSKSGSTAISVNGTVKNVGADGYGDFKLTINYEFSTTKEGFIEVFAKTGETETDLVSIPVKF